MSLGTSELAELRAAAEDSMLDTCKVGTYSAGSQTGPDIAAPSYSYGSAIACGFDAGASDETDDGGQVTMTDAVIRLPIATTVNGTDRIQLTHRHGEALGTAEYYRILGEPRRGVSALVCQVKRIVGSVRE